MEELAAEQRGTLLAVAADAIAAVLRRRSTPVIEVERYDARLRDFGATFVTLERDASLLGCIGTLEPLRPLVADVAHNAVAAAFADPRLPPVGHDDYEVMSIEISLLSGLEEMRVSSFDALARDLRVGTDGLVVDAPRGRATYLPAVWRHFGDDVDAFLASLWQKAGLPPRAWCEQTRCSRYTAEKLVDPGPRPAVGTPAKG
jgi:AmmeMemoRadiSam system protein A